jgi:hypothetical protein
MTLLKVGLKVITITWCFILLLLAMRVFLQWLSVFPTDPIPFIDYTAAMLIIVLAVFSFRENRIAFSVSCMLVLFSVITGVWGMLLLRDGCYLPSAVVAGFGVVYILVKLLEYKKINRKTAALLVTSIVLTGGILFYLSYQRSKRVETIKQMITRYHVAQPENGDFSCLLGQVRDASIVFLGESPHYTNEIRQTVMELSVFLAEHANARVVGYESIYGLHPFLEAESMGLSEPTRHIAPVILNYNRRVSVDQRLLVTALDIEHSINHSKHYTVDFLTHLAARSSSDQGQIKLMQFIPELSSLKERIQLHAYLDKLETLFNTYRETFSAVDWEEVSFSFELMRASVDYQMSKTKHWNPIWSRSDIMAIQEIRSEFFKKTVERAFVKAENRHGKLLCYVGGAHAVKAPLGLFDFPLGQRTEADYFNQIHPRSKGRVASILLHAISFKNKAFRRSLDLEDIAYELMGDADIFYIPLTPLITNTANHSWSKYFTENGPKYDGVLFLKNVSRRN